MTHENVFDDHPYGITTRKFNVSNSLVALRILGFDLI
jgi:hypothetical protein